MGWEPHNIYDTLLSRLSAAVLPQAACLLQCRTRAKAKDISWCMCRAGIERSKIEVRFQKVTVDAKVRVGSAGLPNFKNAAIGFLEVSLLKQDLAQTRLQLLAPLPPPLSVCLRPRVFTFVYPDFRPRHLGYLEAQAVFMPAPSTHPTPADRRLLLRGSAVHSAALHSSASLESFRSVSAALWWGLPDTHCLTACPAVLHEVCGHSHHQEQPDQDTEGRQRRPETSECCSLHPTADWRKIVVLTAILTPDASWKYRPCHALELDWQQGGMPIEQLSVL